MTDVKAKKGKGKGKGKEAPDYKIYGVKKREEFMKIDRELPRPLETMIEKNGACCAIFAPPGSGKSNFLSNLLLRDDFFKDLFDMLYVISPTINADITSEYLKEYADFVETEYSEELMMGIYGNIMAVPKKDRGLSCILLDDCLGQIKINSCMNKLTSQVRHMKSILIYSLQALKGLPPTIRSNISHSIIFYQPSSKQYNDLEELHSFFGGEENFRRCYTESTSVKYGFMLCDWRDLKIYKWGAELDAPEEIWSKFDEAGNLNVNALSKKELESMKQVKKTSEAEPNKGTLKSE
jgi:hypothetical protein